MHKIYTDTHAYKHTRPHSPIDHKPRDGRPSTIDAPVERSGAQVCYRRGEGGYPRSENVCFAEDIVLTFRNFKNVNF